MTPAARTLLALGCLALAAGARAGDLPVVTGVDGQPLGANAERLAKALEFLGFPLAADRAQALDAAVKARDATRIQQALDPLALLQVDINPESRVKVARG